LCLTLSLICSSTSFFFFTTTATTDIYTLSLHDALPIFEARGKRALLVGGTGLYVQAVVDDLRFPGEDPDLRAELDAWTGEPGGVAAAYEELRRRDRHAADKIDPHNARRIVRALEVIRLTGKP